ncbi:hypothetical protein D3C80_1233870 [compost metagenome]
MLIYIGIGLYLFVGFLFLYSFDAYSSISPPSRLVKSNDGYYRYKDYVPMANWVWGIVLTIIWIPYLIIVFIALRNYI